jgi:hypothetical protein
LRKRTAVPAESLDPAFLLLQPPRREVRLDVEVVDVVVVGVATPVLAPRLQRRLDEGVEAPQILGVGEPDDGDDAHEDAAVPARVLADAQCKLEGQAR